MSLTRRNLVQSAGLVAALGALASRPAMAASDAAEIDRDATAALAHLYRIDHNATKLRDKAAGILVFPRVVKAGFIFGGQGGKGVLMEGGKPVRYYTIAAASFGLQAGAQYFSYAMFFLDPAALSFLDKSDGWEVGHRSECRRSRPRGGGVDHQHDAREEGRGHSVQPKRLDGGPDAAGVEDHHLQSERVEAANRRHTGRTRQRSCRVLPRHKPQRR